jgi:hypothetical protein
MSDGIKAHIGHRMAKANPPRWHEPRAAGAGRDTCQSTSFCSFCGSMKPSELVAAINAGANVHWSDFKYGWPHKIYVDDIPNQFAGVMEARSSTSRQAHDPMPESQRVAEGWAVPIVREEIEQTIHDGVLTRENSTKWLDYNQYSEAPAKTHGKFYTEHLKDATDDERAVIEKAMKISFTFHDDGAVSWKPVNE